MQYGKEIDQMTAVTDEEQGLDPKAPKPEKSPRKPNSTAAAGQDKGKKAAAAAEKGKAAAAGSAGAGPSSKAAAAAGQKPKTGQRKESVAKSATGDDLSRYHASELNDRPRCCMFLYYPLMCIQSVKCCYSPAGLNIVRWRNSAT